MPLTTAQGDITTTTGSISQAIFGEQTNYSTQLVIPPTGNSNTDRPVATQAQGFYRYQPRINSLDLAREGETIPTNFFDGFSAQTQDAPGPLDIANGVSFALSGNGTALIWRMLTQDLNPTWTAYGTSGQTFPAEIDIVSATQALTETATSATLTGTSDLAALHSPVQLNFLTTGSATLASGQSQASITIEGTDYWDNFIDETFTFSAASGPYRVKTELWYKTVTKVETAGWDQSSGKTFSVKAEDKSTETIFTPQDEILSVFWTGEIAKGNIPNVYNGLCAQSATIEFTRTGLIAVSCTFTGREGKLYENLAGQKAARDGSFYPQRTDITGAGSDLDPASADVYGGWQSNLTAENTDLKVAAQEGTFTFNQNLVYTNTVGERFQGAPPARDEKRLVQIEATALYARENNYSTYFESNRPIPNVNMRWDQVGDGAYPYSLRVEMPRCQLTADPDPAVSDLGVVTQDLVMKAIRSAQNAYEYRVIARYSDYPALPVRTA